MMTPRPQSRVRRRRAIAAAAAALALHAATLGVMGLVVPKAGEPLVDEVPAVQIALVPSPLAPSETAPGAARPRQALLPSPRASALEGQAAPFAVAPAAPAAADEASNDFPGFYRDGFPGCGREDLMLLTPEEKLRCRNEIEAERARRAARYADETRKGRMEEMRRLPRVDGLPAEKRAYYDAVQAAKEAVRKRTMEGLPDRGGLVAGKNTNIDVNVGVHCSLKFGPNKGKPAGPRFGLNLGPLSCPLTPPLGMGTEEAGITPP